MLYSRNESGTNHVQTRGRSLEYYGLWSAVVFLKLYRKIIRNNRVCL